MALFRDRESAWELAQAHWDRSSRAVVYNQLVWIQNAVTSATSPNYSEQSLENASSVSCCKGQVCRLRNRHWAFRVTVMLRTVLCPSVRPWDCWYDVCGKESWLSPPQIHRPVNSTECSLGSGYPGRGVIWFPDECKRYWWHPGGRDVVKHCLCLLPPARRCPQGRLGKNMEEPSTWVPA